MKVKMNPNYNCVKTFRPSARQELNCKLSWKTKITLLLCLCLFFQSIIPQEGFFYNEKEKNCEKNKNKNKTKQQQHKIYKLQNEIGVICLDLHVAVNRRIDDQPLVIENWSPHQIGRDGNRVHTFWMEGKIVSVKLNTIPWKTRSFQLNGRTRNRLQRSLNGNGTLKIVHWNGGSKHWERKRTKLESLLLELSPDLFFVSESNLFSTTPEWEREIQGYKMIFPKSWRSAGYARIILLVKTGVDLHLLPEHMEEDLSAIWVRVGRKTKCPLHMGGGGVQGA